MDIFALEKNILAAEWRTGKREHGQFVNKGLV